MFLFLFYHSSNCMYWHKRIMKKSRFKTIFKVSTFVIQTTWILIASFRNKLIRCQQQFVATNVNVGTASHSILSCYVCIVFINRLLDTLEFYEANWSRLSLGIRYKEYRLYHVSLRSRFVLNGVRITYMHCFKQRNLILSFIWTADRLTTFGNNQ